MIPKVMILFSLAIAFSLSAFSQQTLKGLGFVAPQVKGTDNVDGAVKGEIVFDATAGVFSGFNGNAWNSLEAGSVSSDVVKTEGAVEPVIYSALIEDGSSEGTVVLGRETGDWITGNCNSPSLGVYECDLDSGAFGSTPNCYANVISTNALFANVDATSATEVTVRVRNYAGGYDDADFTLICHGVK